LLIELQLRLYKTTLYCDLGGTRSFVKIYPQWSYLPLIPFFRLAPSRMEIGSRFTPQNMLLTSHRIGLHSMTTPSRNVPAISLVGHYENFGDIKKEKKVVLHLPSQKKNIFSFTLHQKPHENKQVQYFLEHTSWSVPVLFGLFTRQVAQLVIYTHISNTLQPICEDTKALSEKQWFLSAKLVPFVPRAIPFVHGEKK
jgi:hypothetical protein